jgi:Bacterial Ig-like domain (group 2)
MLSTIRNVVMSTVLAATATACSTGATAAGPATAAGAEGMVVVVFPSAVVLQAGQHVQLVPHLTGADASPLGAEGVSLAWASSNPAVAYVSASGLLSGLAPGTATVTLYVRASCGEHIAVAGVRVGAASDPVDQRPGS